MVAASRGARPVPTHIRRPRRITAPLLATLALATLALARPAPALADGPAAAAAPPVSEAARLTQVGRFFETAEPPSQDFDKARDLYCRAAAMGDAEAVQRLGWLYFRGKGVPTDESIASTLFRWAGSLGAPSASDAARALSSAPDSPAPCLARSGIVTLAALRERQRANAPAPAVPPPSAVVEQPVRFRTTPAPAEQRRIVQMVVQQARAFRLDPRLVLAIVRTESNFDPTALSPKNAHGLMQLIPDTARRFSVENLLDPLDNLRGGMAYLRWLLAYYRGDVTLTLAAYNAGEGAVDRFRGVPPYAETIAYVQRIRALYPFDRHPFDLRAIAANERSWIARDVASSSGATATGLDAKQ